MVSDLIQDVGRRTAERAKLADRVEFRADGEPVLRGTDIEVYRIAALLAGGMPVEDIETDYPSLSRDGIEAAKAYADAHPKPGRPYPRTTAKRALREAGSRRLMSCWVMQTRPNEVPVGHQRPTRAQQDRAAQECFRLVQDRRRL